MARKILFKAWDSHYNVMLDGINISHEGDLLGIYFEGAEEFYTNEQLECEDGHLCLGDDWVFIMDKFTLLQFIGLQDKNGRDIYEGDILKDSKDENNNIGVVYYYAPQFVVQTLEEVPYALAEGKVNSGRLEYTEVIGNIYENPELINP